jgi:hypothetical protein
MPKYLVPVTREATETTMVDVSARSRREAVDKAVAEASAKPWEFDWVADDNSGDQSDPYFAGDDDFESVEKIN